MCGLLAGLVMVVGLIEGINSDCSTVYKNVESCFGPGELSQTLHLECPADHKINIKDASYRISSPMGCAPGADSCKVESLTYRFTENCQQDVCDIEVVKKDEASARLLYPRCQGDHYVQVLYKCEPEPDANGALDEEIHTISLCNDTEIQGSLIRIQSSDDPDDYITQSSCACRVYIEANVQVEFKRLQFPTQPLMYTNCEQRVALWRHLGDHVSICQSNSPSSIRKEYLLGCYDSYDHINIIYENQDEGVEASFIVQASVAQGQKMTVQCGMNATNMEWKTTSTTVRPTAWTTVRSSTVTTPVPTKSSKPSKGSMIGIGVGVAAALILVIIIIVIVIKKRKQKYEESAKTNLPPNTFYATISKGKDGKTFTIGDKSTWPRIHAMPDAPEDEVKNV